MSHISDPPIFSSTCIHTCLYRGFVLVRGGFCSGVCLGFLSGRFRPGWFLSVPLLSEYIHYNRKLNITFNFRFHMYEIFFKVSHHMILDPLPLSQTVTPSWTPLERDVLYGRPLKEPLLVIIHPNFSKIPISSHLPKRNLLFPKFMGQLTA